MKLQIIWILAVLSHGDLSFRQDIGAFKDKEFCEATKRWMAMRDEEAGKAPQEYECIAVRVEPPQTTN